MTDQEKAELIHSLLASTELQLSNIGEQHNDVFGDALGALAIYVTEKIYACAPTMDAAQMLLHKAHDQGVDNWIKMTEAQRNDAPKIVLDS